MRPWLERKRRQWRGRWRRGRAFLAMSRHFTPHLRPRRSRIALAAALGVVYMLVRLVEPWPLKLIFDAVLLGHPLPGPLPSPADARLPLLYSLVGAIVCLALAGGLVYYYQRLLSASLGQELASQLRLDLYGHIQRLSFGFHDRRRTGDLIVRLTSDIRMLREGLVALPLELLEHLLLATGMVIIMLAMDWGLTAIALTMLPVLAALMRRYRLPMKRAVRRQREREGHLASVATEALGAVRVVQGFRGERHEIRRFGSENRRSLRSGLKAARLEAKFKWSTDFAVAVVTAIIITAAARRVLSGALSPGDLIVFVSYLRIFARPFRRVSRVTERMARATAAGTRVLEILETEASIRDLPGAVAAPRFRGATAFEDVWFAHRKERWVLQGIDLEVAPGERVAIVGATGSGKTTLVSLIPRFYEPARGRICIDGHEIRELTLASLRKQISLVFQEPVLFATSIAENIAYGERDVTLEDVRKAARRAGIDRVITRLPQGYDTVVGERGATLSGGERQCVAIARALMRKAPIVILDEPTTGLDRQSAALVREALGRLIEGSTVLMISHVPENVRDADRVVMLEEGRLLEPDSAARRLASAGEPRGLGPEAGTRLR